MAIILTITEGAPSAFAVGNQTMNYTVSVLNNGAADVILKALGIEEGTKTGCRVGQPVFLSQGVPYDVSFPTVSAGATVNYGFQVVSTAPIMPGPSPQAPGGAAPSNAAFYPVNGYTLRATAQTLEGVTTTITASQLFVSPVLTATFPQSNGGALVQSQGFNLINLLTL